MVLVADDFELNGLGAPGDASTLLELVNTNGTTITLLGWYFWNGTAWQLFSSSANGAQYPSTITLAQSAVAVSVTGTLTETTLASVTIPGGVMGLNGSLRITTLWSCTNNANNKTFNVRFGGTSICSNTSMNSSVAYIDRRVLHNRNSLISQVAMPGANGGSGNSTVALVTMTKDTSVDQLLTITMALANTGDTVTLESYTVEVLPG
ncbi:hypothetical protein ACFS07_13325 [Undibacterium arcticum]